jgi:hypothetical protein
MRTRTRMCLRFLLAVSLCGLLWAGNASAQQPVPFNRADLATENQPFSLAVGDFNRDGNPDLAVVNHGSHTVSIFLGNGDGTFQLPQSFSAGRGPMAVTVGDFNHDGNQDLAVVDGSSNSVLILLGKGDGTFEPPQTLQVGQGPTAIIVGDFNHDGNPDLAVAEQGSNTVSILLGNGNGTFQAARTVRVGFGLVALAAGDFNRDGNLDLAVVNQGSNAACTAPVDQERDGFLGDSSGGPVSRARVARGNSTGCSQTLGRPSSVTVLLGSGDGQFRLTRTFVVGIHATSIAVGHFNRVGNDDLVVANQGSHTVSILLGNGGGNFEPTQPLQAGNHPTSVIVADFSGDGNDDVAVTNLGSNTVSILVGNGEGSFQLAHELGVDVSPVAIAVADFDHNGLPDLVTANQISNSLSTWQANQCPSCWITVAKSSSASPNNHPVSSSPRLRPGPWDHSQPFGIEDGKQFGRK